MAEIRFLKVNYKIDAKNVKKLLKIENHTNCSDILQVIIANIPSVSEYEFSLKFGEISIPVEELTKVIFQFGRCACFELDVLVTNYTNLNKCDEVNRSELKELKELTSKGLKIFLEADPEGVEILNEYTIQNTLSKKSRRLFVNLLTNYLRKNCGYYPRKEEKMSIAKAAINLFPSFKVSPSNYDGIDIFYNPDRNTGFLVSNLKNFNNKRHKIEGTYGTIKKRKLSSRDEASVVVGPLHLNIDDQTFFKTCDPDSQYDIIKSKLKNTVGERLQFLEQGANSFDYFPFFLSKPELILYDFGLRYEIESRNLINNWQYFNDKIEGVLQAATGDNFEKFGSWSPAIKSFLALLKLLPPTSFGIKSKQIKRFAFEQCIDLVIQFEYITTPPDSFKRNIKEPHLIASGPNRTTISQYYIQIDGRIITLPLNFKFLEAFDLLFKTYYVFNKDFNDNVLNFYNFIAIYIYKISKLKGSSNLIELFSRFQS